MDFRFGGGRYERGEKTAHETAIDAIISSAGGAPLPGKLGLAQALLGVWTKKHDGNRVLVGSRRVLDTAGLLLAHHRAEKLKKEGETAKELPSKAWLEERNLVVAPHVNHLADFILQNLRGTPVEIRTIGEKDDTEALAIFDLGNGLSCVYVYENEEKARKGTGVMRTEWGSWMPICDGPFILEGREEETIRCLGEKVWETNDGKDLEISFVQDPWGERGTYRLSVLPDAEEYIDDPESNEIGRSSKELAKRCRAFQKRGRSRKILFKGPPGTGKTSIARQLAQDIGCGRGMRIDPKVIKKAQSRSLLELLDLLQPSVLMMDDLDRTREDAEALLHYLEKLKSSGSGWSSRLIVTGTVNTIKTLDPALLRPGRFDEVQHVGYPPPAHRKALVKHYKKLLGVKKLPKSLADVAEDVDGFTPVEIQSFIDSLAAIGSDVYDVELERIKQQKELYTQERIDEYFEDSDSGKVVESTPDPDF